VGDVLQIKPVTPGGGGPSIGLDMGASKLLFYGNSNACAEDSRGAVAAAGGTQLALPRPPPLQPRK